MVLQVPSCPWAINVHWQMSPSWEVTVELRPLPEDISCHGPGIDVSNSLLKAGRYLILTCNSIVCIGVTELERPCQVKGPAE